VRVVRPRHFDGRTNLGFVGQFVNIPERKEHMLQLSGLVVEVFRMAGIEFSNGG
jgi:hypothetical protein